MKGPVQDDHRPIDCIRGQGDRLTLNNPPQHGVRLPPRNTRIWPGLTAFPIDTIEIAGLQFHPDRRKINLKTERISNHGSHYGRRSRRHHRHSIRYLLHRWRSRHSCLSRLYHPYTRRERLLRRGDLSSLARKASEPDRTGLLEEEPGPVPADSQAGAGVPGFGAGLAHRWTCSAPPCPC